MIACAVTKKVLSSVRSSPGSCIVFGVLYTLLVTLAFDPPLPARSLAWTMTAKACLMCCALLAALSQGGFELWNPNDSQLALNNSFASSFVVMFGFLFAYIPAAGGAWLMLYAIWPWARSCDVARKRRRRHRQVPAPGPVPALPDPALQPVQPAPRSRAYRQSLIPEYFQRPPAAPTSSYT